MASQPLSRFNSRIPPALGRWGFRAEADLQRDLQVLDVAVFDAPTHRLHLEPFELTDGFRRPRHSILDGSVDTVERGSDNFDHAVGVVVTHVFFSLLRWRNFQGGAMRPRKAQR